MARLKDADPTLLAPIEGIVFDKDGTLADLERRWVPFFRQIIHTVAHHGQDPEADETLARALGIGRERFESGSPAAVKSEDELITIVLGHLADRGWSAETALAALSAGVEAASFGPLVPLGDVAGSMKTLSGRYVLGIATSDSRANTLDELAKLGIAELVIAVHCGDDGNGVKPEPKVLWGIATGWKLDPGQVLFVGDSLQDLDTARAAGCPFIAVDPTAENSGADNSGADDPNSPPTLSDAAVQADAWVASIEELAAVVG